MAFDSNFTLSRLKRYYIAGIIRIAGMIRIAGGTVFLGEIQYLKLLKLRCSLRFHVHFFSNSAKEKADEKKVIHEL